MILRTLVALAAGVGLSLAFEPVAAPWLIPLAVAAFVLSTRGLRARAGLVPGLAFGVGFYFVLTWWMRSVGTDAWLGMSAFMALFYAVLGAACAVLHARRWWPLWIACAWVTVELWRSGWPFSGMPWGNLSFAVVDTPVADALPYVGSTGVSFLLALLATVLAWLVTALARRTPSAAATRVGALCALLGVVACLTLPSALSWESWHSRPDGTVTVAAVQGDVPGPKGNDILYDFRRVTQNHVQATIDLAADVESGAEPAPDFVVWPENSTAVDPFADEQTNAGIRAAVDAIGVPVLVGAIVDAGETHVLNQGIVWDPVTGAGERYTKHHPVVFGEYIPFRRYLDDLQIGRLSMVGRDMLTGTSKEPLTIAGTRIADAICFDVAYDDGIYDQVSRGAQLLTVQTSNATFIGTDQIEQQFAITRLRAIETGRWVVVASTNGVSGIVAPDGRVVASAEPRTTSVLVEKVGLQSAITPAVRLGAWPGRVLVALSAVGLLLGVLPYRRGGRTAGSTPGDEATAPVTPPHEDPVRQHT